MARRKHIKHALCIYQNIVITSWEEGKSQGKREDLLRGAADRRKHGDVDVKQWLPIASGLLSSREVVSVGNISRAPLARGDPFVFPTPDITLSSPNGQTYASLIRAVIHHQSPNQESQKKLYSPSQNISTS